MQISILKRDHPIHFGQDVLSHIGISILINGHPGCGVGDKDITDSFSHSRFLNDLLDPASNINQLRPQRSLYLQCLDQLKFPSEIRSVLGLKLIVISHIITKKAGSSPTLPSKLIKNILANIYRLLFNKLHHNNRLYLYLDKTDTI
jgi:hypothetical protein